MQARCSSHPKGVANCNCAWPGLMMEKEVAQVIELAALGTGHVEYACLSVSAQFNFNFLHWDLTASISWIKQKLCQTSQLKKHMEILWVLWGPYWHCHHCEYLRKCWPTWSHRTLDSTNFSLGEGVEAKKGKSFFLETAHLQSHCENVILASWYELLPKKRLSMGETRRLLVYKPSFSWNTFCTQGAWELGVVLDSSGRVASLWSPDGTHPQRQHQCALWKCGWKMVTLEASMMYTFKILQVVDWKFLFFWILFSTLDPGVTFIFFLKKLKCSHFLNCKMLRSSDLLSKRMEVLWSFYSQTKTSRKKNTDHQPDRCKRSSAENWWIFGWSRSRDDFLVWKINDDWPLLKNISTFFLEN